MRIAFLADIHANLEALTACLDDARARKADQIVFLGDVVGYGADPAACIDAVRAACAKGALAVRGNHDEAVVGATRFRLNEVAGAAVRWTRSVLGAEDKQFLADLAMTIDDGDRLYVHASARNSTAYPYIHDLLEASASLTATKAQTTFVGHVHDPALYHIAVTGKVMRFIPVAETPIPLSLQRRWLAVMGAVGQPRDGNPAAAYAILDTGLDTATSEITYLRVPYDVDRAAGKIRAAGLPDILWKRLSMGR